MQMTEEKPEKNIKKKIWGSLEFHFVCSYIYVNVELRQVMLGWSGVDLAPGGHRKSCI